MGLEWESGSLGKWLLDVGEPSGGLFNRALGFEEFREGIILGGGERTASGAGHGHWEGDVGVVHLHRVDIDGDAGVGCLSDQARKCCDIGGAGTDARHAKGGGVSEKDFGKGLGDDRAEARPIDGLGSVLPRGTTAEVGARKNDRGAVELAIVERVVGDLASLGVILNVVEHPFRKVIEGDALHEASGDDAIGVDIVAEDGNSGASDLGNNRKRHVWGER